MASKQEKKAGRQLQRSLWDPIKFLEAYNNHTYKIERFVIYDKPQFKNNPNSNIITPVQRNPGRHQPV